MKLKKDSKITGVAITTKEEPDANSSEDEVVEGEATENAETSEISNEN